MSAFVKKATAFREANMRSQSVWATQEAVKPQPKAPASIACMLFVALMGTAVWSGVLWAYQIWYPQ
jgi:hypothetical protein